MRERTSASFGFDYQIARSNDSWPDHIARTNVTAGLIAWLKPASLLDPACGDGSIDLMADRMYPIRKMVLADISVPSISQLKDRSLPPTVTLKVSDIDEVMRTNERFDVIVLTETLEHLEDPDGVLRRAHEKAAYVVASSPEMRSGQADNNPEHLWMFDGDGYFQMLQGTGWHPFHKTHMAFPGLEYDFQVWVCRSAA